MGKNIQRVKLAALERETLQLGYAGEHLHTQIRIGSMEVYQDYPDATVTLTVRPAQGGAYEATVTKDGNNVVWDITSSDTAYAGSGQIQLTFRNGTEVIRTAIGNTNVYQSLEIEAEAPDPHQGWMEQIETEVAGKAEKANTALTDGVTLGAGSAEEATLTAAELQNLLVLAKAVEHIHFEDVMLAIRTSRKAYTNGGGSTEEADDSKMGDGLSIMTANQSQSATSAITVPEGYTFAGIADIYCAMVNTDGELVRVDGPVGSYNGNGGWTITNPSDSPIVSKIYSNKTHNEGSTTTTWSFTWHFRAKLMFIPAV